MNKMPIICAIDLYEGEEIQSDIRIRKSALLNIAIITNPIPIGTRKISFFDFRFKDIKVIIPERNTPKLNMLAVELSTPRSLITKSKLFLTESGAEIKLTVVNVTEISKAKIKKCFLFINHLC